jgi:hypothetical protein
MQASGKSLTSIVIHQECVWKCGPNDTFSIVEQKQVLEALLLLPLERETVQMEVEQKNLRAPVQELKNSGCILEIEYQWARVPIVCQIDLAKRPRKENKEPACDDWASPHGGVPPDPGRGTTKAPRGKRPPHQGIR